MTQAAYSVSTAFGGYQTSLGPVERTTNTAYKGASLASQETYAWRPPFTSGESSTLYDRYLAGMRARDLVRNDPHAAAIVMRLIDMLVGACVRVSPQPDARALGLDPRNEADAKVLHELKRAMKGEFNCYANNPMRHCDAQRRLTHNGQMRLSARTYVTLNETTGYMSWKPEAAARYATCLRLVDPDRLSNPMGQPDTLKLRGGIEYDADGVPLAYHIRNGHPADWFRFQQMLQWTRIPRATSWGRPVFIHGFEPEREDQSRAMTPFASLMPRLRMISKFADTELASATLNALFAAFVYSNLPVQDATAAMTPQGTTFADIRNNFYANNPAFLNGVRIPVMAIGDEVKINSSPRQTQAFEGFQTAFLRSVASARGLSYEQVAMDWSKTNYSSARAALNEVWRHIQTLFAILTEQVHTPIYFAVMEEAFDRGYIKEPSGAPLFMDNPGAYMGTTRWIGPGRGYVDPVKEAEGSAIRIGNLTSTQEIECAQQGLDWEEVLDQAVLEKVEIDARDLVRAEAAPGTIVPDPSDGDPDSAAAAKMESLQSDVAGLAGAMFSFEQRLDAIAQDNARPK
jgi:lambda family phage portal protein